MFTTVNKQIVMRLKTVQFTQYHHDNRQRLRNVHVLGMFIGVDFESFADNVM
jgi:hypothetical protein